MYPFKIETSESGNSLAYGLQIYDLTNNRLSPPPYTVFPRGFESSFSTKGDFMASDMGFQTLWLKKRGESKLEEYKVDREIRSIALSQNGQYAAALMKYNKLRLWPTSNYSQGKTYSVSHNSRKVDFSPLGPILLPLAKINP